MSPDVRPESRQSLSPYPNGTKSKAKQRMPVKYITSIHKFMHIYNVHTYCINVRKYIHTYIHTYIHSLKYTITHRYIHRLKTTQTPIWQFGYMHLTHLAHSEYGVGLHVEHFQSVVVTAESQKSTRLGYLTAADRRSRRICPHTYIHTYIHTFENINMQTHSHSVVSYIHT